MSHDYNPNDDWPSSIDTLLAAAQLLELKEASRTFKLDTPMISFSGRNDNVPSPTESTSTIGSLSGIDNLGIEPKYQCLQCHKVFKTKYTLTIHLRMPDHTKTRPFVCSICGKGFCLSSTLCRHKIIHTADKPHKCQFCSKAFNRSSTLKTHMKIHSTEKDFQCDICGKGFHQKGNLRNHVLVHTGEKPHTCETCGKSFSKLSNLKFHSQTHKS